MQDTESFQSFIEVMGPIPKFDLQRTAEIAWKFVYGITDIQLGKEGQDQVVVISFGWIQEPTRNYKVQSLPPAFL
jgi:hypothetical protein